MKFRHQQGLGLVETVIAVLIIAGSILAIIRFQQSLGYNNNLSQQQNYALILAIKEIETLRDFTALTGANSYASIATGSSTATGTSASYNIAWTITTGTNPNYKTIDVTVSWTDETSTSQSVRLISKVAGIDPSYSATIM